MAMGGSITDTTQVVTPYTPSSRKARRAGSQPLIHASNCCPSQSKPWDSRDEGKLAPATVSHITPARSTSIRGMAVNPLTIRLFHTA